MIHSIYGTFIKTLTWRISIKFNANDLFAAPVRLVGGNWSGEGRVEIYYNGAWGSVCDVNWGINEAQVVCRSLDYSYPSDAPIKAHFGQGSGRIWLENVYCQGHESSIAMCFHRGWGLNDCGHDKDASVICSSKYVNIDLHFRQQIKVAVISG